MTLRNPDSRFLKWSMKEILGEGAVKQSRRDGGGPFPVGAGKMESRVDSAGARSGVSRKYLLALGSMRGIRAEAKPWGDSHQGAVARLVACPWAQN
jgi:hypothetical protein